MQPKVPRACYPLMGESKRFYTIVWTDWVTQDVICIYEQRVFITSSTWFKVWEGI